MITLNINNPEIEQGLSELSDIKKQQLEEVATQAIQQFINSFKIQYKKKDVSKHSHIIQKEYNDSQTNDIALEHIQNSAEYIHNLRRQ